MPENKNRNHRFPTARVRRHGDGYIRLSTAVYNDAFLAIKKASEILSEDPDNPNALSEIENAKVFLLSQNPFGDFLAAHGREMPVEVGIRRMEEGCELHKRKR